jgi:hypothetical protein
MYIFRDLSNGHSAVSSQLARISRSTRSRNTGSCFSSSLAIRAILGDREQMQTDSETSISFYLAKNRELIQIVSLCADMKTARSFVITSTYGSRRSIKWFNLPN